jgi:hypothetical protein
MLLQQLQEHISKLPTYAESSHWVIRKDLYKKMRHYALINAKATRKAKSRKKRLRAKCSR